VKSLKERRRELRKNQTEVEKRLWEELRGRRLNGFKFYRQYSIGPYVVDFYCSRFRLAIELDGKHHGESESFIYDQERERYFKSVNVQTVRFWNDVIMNDIDGVLERINVVISESFDYKEAEPSSNPS
jgi:very-short-patch-repair endonuclease